MGGVDLVPAPGSPAEKREQWIRDHPRLHTVRATIGGTAGIVVPLVIAWLLARFAFWIDLPGIPLPDLPEIPWPHWSLPDWSLPGWVREVLDVLKFIFPVVLAFALPAPRSSGDAGRTSCGLATTSRAEASPRPGMRTANAGTLWPLT